MGFRSDNRARSGWSSRPLLYRNPMLAASILLNTLGLAMPVVILQIFERIVPTQGYETLSVLSILLVVVFVMELVLRLARARLQAEAGCAFEMAIFAEAYGRMVRAKPEAFLKINSGQHLDRVQAINTLRENRTGQRPVILVDVAFAGIFALGIWILSGPLVIVPVCFFCLVLFLGMGLQRMHRHFLSARQSIDNRRYSFFIEFLSGIRTIRTHAIEAQMLRRYEMLAEQSREASFHLVGFAETARSVAAVLGQVSVAAMAFGGGFLVIDGRIGMGTLAACMLLNGRISQPVLKLFTLWAQNESIAQASQKVEAIVNLPQRPESRVERQKLTGRLRFRNALVTGPTGLPLPCPRLNGDFGPGDVVILKGGQGGQAAALFATILGERAPLSGHVDIDGWASERLTTIRGLGGVVYLGDDPVVFQGSVMENITLFGRLPARGGALDIARAVGLDETVRTLSMGYETQTGQDVYQSSPGFLQLVAVTRALAMQPRVLILNNALSALDASRSARIARVLQEQASSRLTILHGEQPELKRIATIALDLSEPVADRDDMVAQWDADIRADRALARSLQDNVA